MPWRKCGAPGLKKRRDYNDVKVPFWLSVGLCVVPHSGTAGAASVPYAAFQGCYSLQRVEMPGCVELGVRSFSECCALERVGTIMDGACYLAIGAVIGQYAFEECAKLSQLSLPHATLATPQSRREASMPVAYGKWS